MELRISRIEAIIPTLATREDLAKLEGLMREDLVRLEGSMRVDLASHATATQAAINQQTWKIIAWVTGVFAMSTATTIFITMRING